MSIRSPIQTGGSELGQFLSGVKVLDLSQYIPGPMAGLFLADMGAEVIKIEPPDGDEMRNLGPRDDRGQPIFYGSMNAGKAVCRINLKDPARREEFLCLAGTADVVIEGFRPGVMKRLGIDYSVLSQVNPGIVLCSISGYGATSPLAMTAGHDANYLAMMGTLDRNGVDAPAYFDPPISDIAGSLFAALTILGALHGRGKTGKGCRIDLALADTVMSMQMMQVAAYGATRWTPRRGSYYLNGGAAYYQTYELADGRHAFLGAVEPKFWKAFCLAAGRPDWIARQADAEPQAVLRAEVAEHLGGLTSADALACFGAIECCFTMVSDLGQALATPHVANRQLVREDDEGRLQSLFPAWINGSPPAIRPAMTDYDTSASAAPPQEPAGVAKDSLAVRQFTRLG